MKEEENQFNRTKNEFKVQQVEQNPRNELDQEEYEDQVLRKYQNDEQSQNYNQNQVWLSEIAYLGIQKYKMEEETRLIRQLQMEREQLQIERQELGNERQRQRQAERQGVGLVEGMDAIERIAERQGQGGMFQKFLNLLILRIQWIAEKSTIAENCLQVQYAQYKDKCNNFEDLVHLQLIKMNIKYNLRKYIRSMLSMQIKTQNEKKMDEYKQKVMSETQVFHDSKFNDENSRLILLKLIYLLNQGIEFNDEEIETLFFRITKLFQASNPRVRCITYKLLKMIMPKKYVHIILQSLIKDLISDNPIIKVEALKFIPFICDEQYIQSMERFIYCALQDSNLLISSTALLVGIQIVNKFPNFISQWLFDVVQKLDQQKESLQYHALILFYEMKKQNLTQVVKIIIVLLNKELQPFAHHQIIKIIREILPKVETLYKKELIQYLFSQARNQEPLTFFESSKVLLSNFDINNDELITMNKCVEKQFQNETNNVTIFCLMNLTYVYIKHDQRRPLFTDSQIECIKDLTFSSNLNQSLMGLLFFFKLNAINIEVYMSRLFNKQRVTIKKLCFLHGIQEIIQYNSEYINSVLKFLEITTYDFKEVDLVEQSIKIVKQILTMSDQYKRQAIRILRTLASNPVLVDNSPVIRLIVFLLLEIQKPIINDHKVNQLLQYMKDTNFIYNYESKSQSLKGNNITLESIQNISNNQNRYK